MPLPFDPSRRGSLGGSPPHYARGPLDSPSVSLPPFQSRSMPPPPSPPQMPPPSSSFHNAARGPPTTSPFPGVRDLASYSTSNRSGNGMAISSILSGGDDRRSSGSPNASSAPTSATTKTMQLPSPGRARSSSLREGIARKDESPIRPGGFGEPRTSTAFHERTVSDSRADGLYGSPQYQRESVHSFRNFQPHHQDHRSSHNGIGQMGRPSSQPADPHAPYQADEHMRREPSSEGRYAPFRQYSDPHGPAPGSEPPSRHGASPFHNGVTSQPRDRDDYGHEREPRHEQSRYQPGIFGTSMREEPPGLFRPSYQGGSHATQESIESRAMHDSHREAPRSTPPISDMGPYDRHRNGYADRPFTYEDHRRMEATQRDYPHRKGSDPSMHRSVLNISPELDRRGRNSPLPQAVQGAQPRHVGPGGNNPGIKMEFGRMFSGLGSGVGSTTPNAGQSINGSTTPSRMSPMRHVEDGDLVRTAVAGIEDGTRRPKGKSGRKSGRRSREDTERLDVDGRATPDLQRGNKRSKTAHHHHHHVHPHHHHHHHDNPEAQAGSFNMLRFPSNPGVQQSTPSAQPAHHHHHHHNQQTHASHHHHHHAPRPMAPPRKPTTTILSKKLLDECASKPRKHLGSHLYTTKVALPSPSDSTLDAQTKLTSQATPMPLFEGKENCTFTIRVPRFYLTPTEQTVEGGLSPLDEICKRRQLWGTEVYTDDSDVVVAAVHAGWLKGDFGEWNDDVRDIDGDEADQNGESKPQLSLMTQPKKPIKTPKNMDAHIEVLILSPLEKYTGTHQNHIPSRDWSRTHDGMSFMINRIDFVDEGLSSRYAERGLASRKQRLAQEEAERREAAAGLLLFANGNSEGSKTVEVGA